MLFNIVLSIVIFVDLKQAQDLFSYYAGNIGFVFGMFLVYNEPTYEDEDEEDEDDDLDDDDYDVRLKLIKKTTTDELN